MSALDRLDEIESHLDRQGYHPHKDVTYALVAALRAVLDLHPPSGVWAQYCAADKADYPCPTVDAITAALDPS